MKYFNSNLVAQFIINKSFILIKKTSIYGLIDVFNNNSFIQQFKYLKSTIDSLKKNTSLKYEIIVHVNDGSDGTIEYLKKKIFCLAGQKITLVYAPLLIKLLNYQNMNIQFILYDCYFCPSWDKVLINEINVLNHNKFIFHALQQNIIWPHIKFDCGKDLKSFNEKKFLENYKGINFYDHQGTHWSPLCVHIDLWNKVGGFSEEFNPGIGSDPDFNMKLWEQGVRIFKGINDFKVYHFASLTTRKNTKVIQNRGDNTFLKKWGFTIKFFKRFYMRTNEKYDGPLNEPSRNILFYFNLIICKIKLLYVYFLKK